MYFQKKKNRQAVRTASGDNKLDVSNTILINGVEYHLVDLGYSAEGRSVIRLESIKRFPERSQRSYF